MRKSISIILILLMNLLSGCSPRMMFGSDQLNEWAKREEKAAEK